MRKTILALALGSALSTLAFAADIKVNGVAIPESRIDVIVNEMIQQGQAPSPELRDQAIEQLILAQVLAQEAVKQGVDKQADFVEKLANAKQNLLANAYVQDWLVKNPPSEAELKVIYDEGKAQMEAQGTKPENMMYKFRHILVKDEATAKSIIAKLKKGGSFEKLANEFTEDPGSKTTGGLYDNVPLAKLDPAFSAAMAKLAKGKTTDTPVKTSYGYHVIKLEDIHKPQFPSFEQAKPSLGQDAQQRKMRKMLDDIKKTAKIEMPPAAK